MRPAKTVTLSLLSLLVLSFVSTVSAAPAWKALQTPRYQILSQLDESDTLAWAEEFDRFLAALGTEIQPVDRLISPLTVLLFSRDRYFSPYKPARPDGDILDVAGLFVSRDTWSVIGMARHLQDDEQTRRTIFHEGVHWYMNSLPFKAPLWLHEGMAEVFSSFSTADGKMSWGNVLANHVLHLRKEKLMPLERLLAVRSGDPLFNDEDSTQTYYAQSWALVHYLIFAQRDGERSALKNYLEAYNRSESTATSTLLKSLGKSCAELEKALENYVHEGKYFKYNVPTPPASGKKPVFSKPSELEIEVAHAKLALCTGRAPLAKQHVEKIRQLAPEQPIGFDLLTWLAVGPNDHSECGALAEQALKHGSEDAWTLTIAATSRLMDSTSLAPDEARAVANLCERAINRRPNLEAAYASLAVALSFLDKPLPDDLAFIAQGRRFFPDNGALPLFLAQAAQKRGDKAEAKIQLEAAIARQDGLDIAFSTQVRQLADQWALEEEIAETQRLVADNKSQAAFERFDRWLASAKLGFDQNRIAQQHHQQLLFLSLADRVQTNANAGNLKEAAAHFASLEKNFTGREHKPVLDALRKLFAGSASLILPTFPGETFTEVRFDADVRIVINQNTTLDPAKPVRLILFALPAGGTIEGVIGRKPLNKNNRDENRFDIHHIAAQTRWLRRHDTAHNIVVAYLQPDKGSWILWREKHRDHKKLAGALVASLRERFPGASLVLSAHSAGGHLLMSYIEHQPAIPAEVERIAFLDANYSYNPVKKHADKLSAWLSGGKERHLCVLAYEDHVALYKGKTFVSAQYGTWGRSQAMMKDLGSSFAFTPGPALSDGIQRFSALGGRIEFLLKENPTKEVWHNRLVELNGFIHSMLSGTERADNGYTFLGPRVYEEWIADPSAPVAQ